MNLKPVQYLGKIFEIQKFVKKIKSIITIVLFIKRNVLFFSLVGLSIILRKLDLVIPGIKVTIDNLESNSFQICN